MSNKDSESKVETGKQNQECDHNWVVANRMTTSAGEMIYYRCTKCPASKSEKA
jgi:hypothetical protein